VRQDLAHAGRDFDLELANLYVSDAMARAILAARPGFAKSLEHIAGNGIKTILVESPDRFARDLTVQLTGHDFLKSLGVALIPTTAPDFFTQDTPTAVLVRQVLGAIAQFEKASLVLKLKAARDRKRAKGEKCEGAPSYLEMRPDTARFAFELFKEGTSFRQMSRDLAAAGHLTRYGKPYSPTAVRYMVLQYQEAIAGRWGKSLKAADNATIA